MIKQLRILLLLAYCFTWGSLLAQHSKGKPVARSHKQKAGAKQKGRAKTISSIAVKAIAKSIPAGPHTDIDQSKNVIEVFPERYRAYKSIVIEPDERSIRLDALPDTMILNVPEMDYQYYTFTLKENDTLTLILSFHKNLESGAENYLIKPSDFGGGRLILLFKEGRLIRIGSTQTDYAISAKKPQIRIRYVSPPAASPERKKDTDDEVESTATSNDIHDLLKPIVRQERITDVGSIPIDRAKFYKGGNLCRECGQYRLQTDGITRQEHAGLVDWCKRPFARHHAGMNINCHSDTITSLYNQIFMKPCASKPGKKSDATSLKYRIVIDARDELGTGRNRVTYLKLKNRRGYEYYKVKKVISPKAYRDFQVDIIGPDTSSSGYTVEIDDANDYFLGGEAGVTNQLSGMVVKELGIKEVGDSVISEKKKSAALSVDSAKASVNSPSPNNQNDADNSTTAPSTPSANDAEEIKSRLSIAAPNTLELDNDNNISHQKSAKKLLKIAESDSLKAMRIGKPKKDALIASLKGSIETKTLLINYSDYQALNPYLESFWAAQKQLDLLVKASKQNSKENTVSKRYSEEDSTAKANRDALLHTVEAARTGALANISALINRDYVLKMKGNLLSLHEALKVFNKDYYNVGVHTDDWIRDFTELKLKIVETFDIGVIANSDELEKQLIKMIYYNPRIDPRYYDDFADLIGIIAGQYKKSCALPGNSKIKVVSKQLTVPNHDYFTLRVKDFSTKPFEQLYKNDFSVSCGFQIDFSTGFFLNGLVNHEYETREVKYLYRGATFLVNTASGKIDTTFTGTIDTAKTNRLFMTNNNDHTFGSGFMIHAYTRTGNWYNFGLGIGAMYDSRHEFDYLFGGSVMLNTKPSRITLTAGLSVGREKTLAPGSHQYEDQTDNNYTLKNFRSEVPLNYTNTQVQYQLQWASSWYFGVTFNFASLTGSKSSQQ